MASKTTSPMINGAGHRKLASWIESFLEFTDNIETSPSYRLWTAISTLAATMERKVFMFENDPLFPNLFILLVGHAGTGKTRSIRSGRNFIRALPEPLIAPTSMTMASLADILAESKRVIIRHPDPAIEYNTLYLAINEFSAFMHDYKHAGELVAGLTDIYDCDFYGQARRGNDLRISIEHPQLNLIAGTTPAKLLHIIPEYAWDDGFMSRIIMVFADDKPMIDTFAQQIKAMPADMMHDLKVINSLIGEVKWSPEWSKAMNDWKELDFTPRPTHPKLEHYATRRFTNMHKLSMISCVDRGNDLLLTKEDFNRAMGWLLLTEREMVKIFDATAGGMDSKAIDDIKHYIEQSGENGVSEHKVINYARMHIQYARNAPEILTLMEKSGLIRVKGIDRNTGLRWFTIV